MEQQSESQKVSRLICTAYERDLNKPSLQTFKEVCQYSRKFGFPLVCNLKDMSEPEQLHWAASLLLEVVGAWPQTDIPEQLVFEPGSALLNDAKQLLANGLGNRKRQGS